MNDRLILTLSAPQTQTLVLSAPTSDATRARIFYDTTEHWSQKTEYIPPLGTIIVYTDRNVIDGVKYAGVKLGDGHVYVVDLPFVGDDIAVQFVEMLNEHIGNTNIHVTTEEKEFWNNKLNLRIEGEELILNRL